jgi:hypothetical protein
MVPVIQGTQQRSGHEKARARLSRSTRRTFRGKPGSEAEHQGEHMSESFRCECAARYIV